MRPYALLTKILRVCGPDGRVPSQSALSEALGVGEWAIRAAWRVLLDQEYIVARRRRRPDGTYESTVWIKSHPRKPRSPLLVTSDSVTVDVTNHLPSGDGGRVTVGYEFFERTSDGDEGEVGRLPSSDKIRAKYGKVTVPARTDRRAEKAVSQYTVPDLISEFTDRVKKVTDRTSQVNRGALAGRLGAWRKDGITQQTIISGMDMFFEDPRNLRDLGEGKPLWIRFVVFFPDRQAEAARRAGQEKSGLDEMAEQVAESGTIALGKVRW